MVAMMARKPKSPKSHPADTPKPRQSRGIVSRLDIQIGPTKYRPGAFLKEKGPTGKGRMR